MNERIERILSAIASLADEEREVLFNRLASEWSVASPTQKAMPLDFEAREPEGEPDYVIVFDGGSEGNPGPGYGSYALSRRGDEKQRMVRLDFGRDMTNNEAEYETLIAALRGLIERIELASRSPGEFSLEVRGDSKLVLNQVSGRWKAKDDRMRALRNRARNLLSRFGAHRLVHQDREESVRVLGH
ncbi:MAG: ribonuclease HI family protein [Chloroflexota bacterium]|nr:ribonuclease HI family protein [Chloroflexota bacterium]